MATKISPIEQGVEKSAIVLLSIGAEEAAEVFKFLGPKEVQRLGTAMAKTKGVTKEKIAEVAKEVIDASKKASTLGVNSDDYIRKVLNSALGEDKAAFLLDRILQGSDTSGIEGLKWMDPTTIAELIKNEYPQTIAAILVHLERDHAAAILNKFPERLIADVMLRIATLDGIQPAALVELNEYLSKVIAGGEKLKKTTLGGTRAAAEILNYVGSSAEKTVLTYVEEFDHELAQSIEDEMFTFENLLDVSDRDIQRILREIPQDVLVVAIKGIDEVLTQKIMSNMSARMAESLLDEIETRGPVRLSDSEAAQKEILKTVRRLSDEGEVQIGKGGDDAYV